MKNNLQQLLILTFLLVLCLSFAFLYFPQFVYLTIFMETIAIITCGYLIFKDRRNTASKLAWILAILFIPYLGVLLFFLIGKNPKSRKMSVQQKVNEYKIQSFVSELIMDLTDLTDKKHVLSRELFQLSGKQALKGNQLEMLHDGKKAFEALIEDIMQAKHHVHVFYFIIKDDSTGEKLIHVLTDQAKQGIQVRLMYDSLGSIKLPNDLLITLEKAGGEVKGYDPVSSPRFGTRFNWRNHRKMVIIDGQVTHIGGMNIGDEYLSKSDKFLYWRDTNLRIEGAAVLEVQEIFIHDWVFLEESKSILLPFFDQKDEYFPIQQKKILPGETIQILYGGPYDEERIIRDSFIDIVGKATKSIKISMPYFVPDEESLAALRRAARCGIKVQVIIPGKGDRGVSFHGSNSFISRLLTAGIEVYSYDSKSFLHCKIMIVDEEIATVGSTNFDIRSFHLNHEMSAFIYGPSEGINDLNKQFLEDLKQSNAITNTHQKQSLLTVVKERISELFIPLL